MEVDQCFFQCFEVVGFIDVYDVVVFVIVCGVQGKCQVEFYFVVVEFFDYFGDFGSGYGQLVWRNVQFGSKDFGILYYVFVVQ